VCCSPLSPVGGRNRWASLVLERWVVCGAEECSRDGRSAVEGELAAAEQQRETRNALSCPGCPGCALSPQDRFIFAKLPYLIPAWHRSRSRVPRGSGHWQVRGRSLLGPGVPVREPHGGTVLLFQAAALAPGAASGEPDAWLTAKTQDRKYGNKSRSEM